MLKTLKKYFIPHQHNDHQPHILRWKTALIILSAVLLIEVFFLIQAFGLTPWSNFFASIMPGALIDFTNQNRLVYNLTSLQMNPLLEKAAQLKADDMAAKSYFDHTSPAGLTPWHWLKKTGYQYLIAGENLAINFTDSKDATDAWMNSPAHRANILNNNFTEIGIATAQGQYDGQATTFIVQFFGRPAQETALKNQPAPPEKNVSVPPASSQLPSQMFIAVKGAAQNNTAPSDQTPAPNQPNQPSFFNNLLTNPRTVSNYFYFVFLTILSLALLLKIFIKTRTQHPALIINGVALIIVISSLIWINQYVAFFQTKII